jgi:hypothetical protein
VRRIEQCPLCVLVSRSGPDGGWARQTGDPARSDGAGDGRRCGVKILLFVLTLSLTLPGAGASGCLYAQGTGNRRVCKNQIETEGKNYRKKKERIGRKETEER